MKYDKLYPNLYTFVKKNIIPSELNHLEQVIYVYIELILHNLYDNDINKLEYLLSYLPSVDERSSSISPSPSYLDTENPVYTNLITNKLTESKIIEEFKSSLDKDKIKHKFR